MSNEFKLKFVAVPEIDKVGTKTAEKDIVDFFKKIAGSESLKRLNDIFVNMPKKWNASLGQVDVIAQKFKDSGKDFSSFEKEFTGAFNNISSSSTKAWNKFSELFRLGKIDESFKALQKLDIEIKKINSDIKNTTKFTPSQLDAKREKLSSLQEKRNETKGVFKQYVSEYNQNSMTGNRLSTSYKTFVENGSISDVSRRKTSAATELRQNLNEYEKANIDLTTAKRKATDSLKKQLAEDAKYEKMYQEGRRKREAEANRQARKKEIEDDRLARTNFRDQRNALIKSGQINAKTGIYDTSENKSFYSRQNSAELRSGIAKTQEDIKKKSLKLLELTSDTTKMPDKDELTKQVKLIASLKEKEKVMKSILAIKEKEAEAEKKANIELDKTLAKTRGKGYPVSMDFNQKRKFENRSLVELVSERNAVGSDWVKEKERLAILQKSKNVSVEEIETHQRIFNALDKELKMLNKIIEQKEKGKIKPADQNSVLTDKQKLDILKEQMRIRNYELETKKRINSLSGEDLKKEKEKLNLDAKIDTLQKNIVAQRQKMINAKTVSKYDEKQLRNMEIELSLTERLNRQLTTRIQKGQEEGTVTKTFAEHLEDAVNNAFTLEKVLNRVAFVFTAKLAYDAFDFVKQSLQEGVQNAIALEASLARIASITEGQSQDYAKKSVSESVKMGFSVEDSAKAYYDAVSSQFTTAEASKLMETSTRMAVAGATTQTEAFNALISVLKSYKLSINDADKVSDIFFETIRLGRTTLAEIAPDIGKISATANLLGISFEEVSAGLATMTLNGIKTDVALTSMNQLMMNLADPTKEAQEIFEKHNLTLDIARIKTIGFAGVVKELNKLTDQEITQIASSRQGFRALATAIQSNTEWQENLNMIVNSGGKTLGAYNRQMETADMQLKQLKGSFLEMGIAIGDILKIGLTLVSSVLMPLISGLDKTTIGIGAFGAAAYGAVKGVTALLIAVEALNEKGFKSLLTKSNVITALLVASVAVYGIIKNQHADMDKFLKSLRDKAINQSQDIIDKKQQELKLLETYKSLSEKEASGIKLSRTEKQLLIDTQNVLNDKYEIGIGRLKDYNKEISNNIEEQRKRFELIRQQKIIEGKPGFSKNRTILESKYTGYEDIDLLANLASKDDGFFSNPSQSENYKKYLTFNQSTIDLEENIGKKKTRESISDIEKILEDYDAFISSLNNKANKTNYKEINRQVKAFKEATANKYKALTEMKEYLMLYTEKLEIDTDATKPSTGDGGGKKTSSFNSPTWRKAKDEYETNQTTRNLDSLLTSKNSYLKEINSYKFEDPNEALRLKEEARGDVQDLVDKTNKRSIRQAENVLKSKDSLDDIIVANSGVLKAYDEYIRQLTKIKASQETISQIEDEKNARANNGVVEEKADKYYKGLIKQKENQISSVTEMEDLKIKTEELGKIYEEYAKSILSITQNEDKSNAIIDEYNSKAGKTDPKVQFLNKLKKSMQEENAYFEELNYAGRKNLGFMPQFLEREKMSVIEIQEMLVKYSEEFAVLKEMEKKLKDILSERARLKEILDSETKSEMDKQAANFSIGGLIGVKQNEHQVRISKANQMVKKGDMDKSVADELTKDDREAIKVEQTKDAYSRIQEAASQALDFYDTYLDRRLEQIEAEKQAQLSAIDEQAKMQYRSSWWVEKEKKKVEEKSEKERKKIAKQKKTIAYSEALMNGAVAITNVFKLWAGTPMAWVFAALTAAMTGIQLATINAQKFEKGRQVPYGKLNGKRHSQGGELIEVEGGEWIFSRKAVAGNEELLDGLQTKLEKGGSVDSMILKKEPNVNKASSNIVVKNDMTKLENKLDNVVDSIKDMKIEVGMYGEYISDVKLAKRVQNGNKQRRVL